jgi:hypothetical protein
MPTDLKRLLIGFFVIQLLTDLSHSLTLFPFIHYAMYSGRVTRPDSLAVFEIVADGVPLRPADFRIYQWDVLQNALVAYEKQVNTTDFAFDREKMSEGLQRVGAGALYKTLEINLTNAGGMDSRFPLWYKTYLSGVLGHSIKTLEVDKAWYRYGSDGVRLLRKETRIKT